MSEITYILVMSGLNSLAIMSEICKNMFFFKLYNLVSWLSLDMVDAMLHSII